MEHFGHIPDPAEAPLQPQPTSYDENWLIGRIELILAGYRKADYHNLQMFMAQAIMNLMKFPKEVIEYVSAPQTGIQTRLQWPPSLAEIVEACIAEQNHRDKIARYSDLPRLMPRLPRPKFSSEQSYETMLAKYGRPTGVFEAGREHPYGE